MATSAIEPPANLWDGPPAGENTAVAVRNNNAPAPLAQATAGVIQARGETASSAVAAQAKAQVEARYLMALQQPRSYLNVRRKLLDACQRPGFAKTARYAKPVGKEKVRGFSIRFAEEVARALGNVLIESAVVFDDDQMRIVRVMVTDLEANLSYPTDVTIRKTVERKFLKQGQEAISRRINSYNEPVYIIEATDDDVLNKQNALVSKAMRSGILRIVPADILEECEAQVQVTVDSADAKDPAGAAKVIADAFYAKGVMPDRLEKLLGHPIALSSPAEVSMMREWLTALKEGEAKWSDIEDAHTDGRTVRTDAAKDAGAGDNGAPKSGNSALRDRLKKDKSATERQPGEEG